MPLPVLFDLRKRSTDDVVKIIFGVVVGFAISSTIIVGIWRPMRIEVIQYVYQLLSYIVGAITGKAFSQGRDEDAPQPPKKQRDRQGAPSADP